MAIARPRLSLYRDGKLLHTSKARTVLIGRGPMCEVRLPDPHISSRHSEIVPSEHGLVYRDLKSRNGSEIRRGLQKIPVDASRDHECTLMNGDELRVGNPLDPIILQVRMDMEEGTTEISIPIDKTITTTNRYADLDTITLRVSDDKRSLQCLYKLLGSLNAAHDSDAVLATLADLLFDSFGEATHLTVHLRPGDSARTVLGPGGASPAEDVSAEDFVPVLARSRSGKDAGGGRLSRMLLDRITHGGEGLLFEDAGKSFVGSESIILSRVQSGICVPLWNRKEIRGVLQVDNRKFTGAFVPKDLDLITLIGNHVALVLDNIDMYQNLVRLNRDLSDALERIQLLDKAKEHLSKFVPETVKRLVDQSPESPQLDMIEGEATVLFLDIGGYTKLSEKLDRDKVSFLVERYFSSFIDDIYANHGDINETAGDGLMIIFRADEPAEHARAAVRAALSIRRKTREINRELDGESPPIDVNQGINTGPVYLGSRRIQGITGVRWTYTATGMVTNISARLAAHAVGGQILIGDETAERVRPNAVLLDLGRVQFKNVSQTLPVFEVLDEPAQQNLTPLVP